MNRDENSRLLNKAIDHTRETYCVRNRQEAEKLRAMSPCQVGRTFLHRLEVDFSDAVSLRDDVTQSPTLSEN